MKPTLLFDLDGTLLDTNLDTFVPAYFQKLAAHLSARVPPETLLKYLMVGTRAMMANADPNLTLKTAFDTNFYPHLGIDQNELLPAIEEFYDEVFPSLREITKPVRCAVELIEWAFAEGYRVAIATNPLFPSKAIFHRLRWANLPPETYPFELISTYDSFHFTKPRPDYYAEVLGRLGWPDGPVVMIGNDVEADLKPAAALGIATFHALDTATADGFQSTRRGLLVDVRPWLEQTDPAILQPTYTSLTALLAILRSTPAVITGLTKTLPATGWAARPATEEWSTLEVICHMRDVEREIDQPRIAQIIQQDEPFIPAQMPDEWVGERGYRGEDGRTTLEAFTRARLETLQTLASLESGQWSRKGRHAIFGPTTLQELVSFNAEHDRLHIQQIWKNLLADGAQ